MHGLDDQNGSGSDSVTAATGTRQAAAAPRARPGLARTTRQDSACAGGSSRQPRRSGLWCPQLGKHRITNTRIKGPLARTVARLYPLCPAPLKPPAWIGAQPADKQRVVSHHRPGASALGVRQMSHPADGVPPPHSPQERSHMRRATGPAWTSCTDSERQCFVWTMTRSLQTVPCCHAVLDPERGRDRDQKPVSA
jgi:hypothetical protein